MLVLAVLVNKTEEQAGSDPIARQTLDLQQSPFHQCQPDVAVPIQLRYSRLLSDDQTISSGSISWCAQCACQWHATLGTVPQAAWKNMLL